MQTTIKLDSISYQMYLPNSDKDSIQKYIFATKQPYEQEVLETILKFAKNGGGDLR